MGGARLDDSAFQRADKTQTTDDALLTSGIADFGALVEIIAQTAIRVNYVNIYLHANSTANEFVVETFVGPIGNEMPALGGILYHTNINGLNIETIAPHFKVEIPKGVRVSAKVKAINASDTIKIKCVFQGTDY